MYACMYGCMYLSMYLCMHVWKIRYIEIFSSIFLVIITRSGAYGEGSADGPLSIGGYQLSCVNLTEVSVGFYCELGGKNLILEFFSPDISKVVGCTMNTGSMSSH